jgi:hypothetical protein
MVTQRQVLFVAVDALPWLQRPLSMRFKNLNRAVQKCCIKYRFSVQVYREKEQMRAREVKMRRSKF